MFEAVDSEGQPSVTGVDRSGGAPIIVIGGGIVGLSCAWRLARDGEHVVVVDRDVVGAGCGIGSAGHLVPGHVWPLAAPGMQREALFTLVRPSGGLRIRVRPQTLRWLGSFVRHCRASYATSGAKALASLAELSMDELAIIETEATGLALNRVGLLDVYRTKSGFERASRHTHTLRDHGVDAQPIGSDEALAIEPALRGAVTGAIHFRDDACLRPSALLGAVQRLGEDAGVELRNRVEATELDGANGSVTSVITNRGALAASHVVIATGAWSGTLAKSLRQRVPIEPARGYSVTFQSTGNTPRQPMLLGEDQFAVAAYDGLTRLSGRFHIGAQSTNPDDGAIDGLWRLARRRLELPAQPEESERWAGLRPVTPDGLPLIGAARNWNNVTIAAGHAMVGLTMGPGTGRVVAEQVLGHRPSIALDRFDPGRFQP